MRITPEQMLAQWVGLDHTFEINEYNFEVRTTRDLTDLFKKSFERKAFDGKTWPAWTPAYAKWVRQHSHSGHSMLRETGSLRSSLKPVVEPLGAIGKKQRKSYVHTDPGAFGNTRRNPGFCFAAVHNNYNELTNKPSGPKFERQFMGHSKETKAILFRNEAEIFRGFPGVTR